MGYDYECPDCGREYGENSSLGSIPKSNLCDSCADKKWEKEIRKEEREKVLDELVSLLNTCKWDNWCKEMNNHRCPCEWYDIPYKEKILKRIAELRGDQGCG